MRDIFKHQIEQHAKVTEDIFEKINFKRVWSGKMIEIGDRVLFALVFPKNEDDPKIMALLERELDELSSVFEFSHFDKETIPVLKFKGDTKVRNV
jgi:hypothetical protein